MIRQGGHRNYIAHDILSGRNTVGGAAGLAEKKCPRRVLPGIGRVDPCPGATA